MAARTGNRPRGVKVAAGLAIIGVVVVWMFGGYAISVSDFYILSITVLGFVFLALGVVYLSVAGGLWDMKVQSWWLGMTASAIAAVAAAAWLVIVTGFSFIPPAEVGLYFGFPILLFVLAILLPLFLLAVRENYTPSATA